MPFDDTKAWRQKRRQRILEAAAELFARNTYQAVQIDDVAHLAGTGKATVYRYFPSKQELYLEGFDQALGVLEDAVASAAIASVPPPERLEAMLRTLFKTFAEQLPSLQVLGGDDSHLAERGRQVFRRRAARIADRLRAVMDEGIATGRFRSVDTEVFARMLISMARGAAIASAYTSHERALDAVLDMTLRGGLAVNFAPPLSAESTAHKRWSTAR